MTTPTKDSEKCFDKRVLHTSFEVSGIILG